MTLLDDIRSAAITATSPLGELLRLMRVLAAELESEEVEIWVRHEMRGYEPGDELPVYRTEIHTPVKGTFVGPYGSTISDALIPPIKFRDYPQFFRTDFRQAVVQYEDLLQGSGHALSIPWPADLIYKIALERVTIFEMHQLMSAHQMVPRSAILGVVEGVRNGALEFVIGLTKLTKSTSTDLADVSVEQTARLFNITVNGGTVSLVVADGDVVNALSLVIPGDIASLMSYLTTIGVDQALRDDLMAILHEQKATPATHAQRTAEWFKRLPAKIIRGGASVIGQTLSGLASQALSVYFGLTPPGQ